MYRISGFFRVSQILRKKGKLVHFSFCGSYFLRFKSIYRDLLWHTITNIISTCFIFCEFKMVVKNAKIRLPRKKRIYGMQSLDLRLRSCLRTLVNMGPGYEDLKRYCSHIAKSSCMCFIKKNKIKGRANIAKKCIVIYSMKVAIKIVYFMIPGLSCSVPRVGQTWCITFLICFYM
jgi:hypothetical protein